MPMVSCPSCSTNQDVESGADGYTCTSCGASWGFVTCSTCGSRFHARPGSTGWTCPNCGTPHGTSAERAAQADPAPTQTAPSPPSFTIKGDDLDATEPEPLRGPQSPFSDHDQGSDFPMPRRADRGPRIPPWVFVAAGAIVVALIAIFVFTRGGDDAPSGSTPTGSAAMEQVCEDVQQLQVLRTDALGRAQDDLKADAAALRETGDKATAKKVDRLVAAVGDYRTALEDQQDTGEATSAMTKAVTALNCS